MPNVFLSYAREDFARAGTIAAALEKANLTVWWDERISGGSEFSKEIEQALRVADAIVVLWSAASVDSPWVRDEAAKGRDSGKLVPATLDCTEPPLGFGQFHTNQPGWKASIGRPEAAGGGGSQQGRRIPRYAGRSAQKARSSLRARA